MIGYQMVGTNNIEDAAKFYDALLGEMGATRYMEDERFIAWAVQPGTPAFSICQPYDEKEASVGNGSMTAFAASSPEMVDKLYNKAIELGASCEGPSGPRGESGFYAGYFRDLDGNKMNFFCMGA